jgi:uncharacterized protein YydD (DUF2326 family)
MIISIESSIATFKSVNFHTGLNVLLADTQPQSTNKQTRNSAGKTSLIEIIHFLLGANCDKESLFRTSALVAHTFIGTFDIGGRRFKVLRGGADHAKVFLLEGGEDDPNLLRKTDKESGRVYISNGNWRAFLGQAMFRLPVIAGTSAFDEPGAPTFRAMFAYFARRRNAGAFLHPEQHARQQQRGDWQVNLSYLLGLDWQIALEFQKVRGRERTLEELKKAAQGQMLGQVIGTVAELRPQVTVAETRAQRLRAQLTNFEVLDSYRDLSQRAARAKTDMQALGRQAVGMRFQIGSRARARSRVAKIMPTQTGRPTRTKKGRGASVRQRTSPVFSALCDSCCFIEPAAPMLRDHMFAVAPELWREVGDGMKG